MLVGFDVRIKKTRNEKSDKSLRKVLKDNLDHIAEVEHNGWMEHKLRTNFTYGYSTDKRARKHADLIPFESLPASSSKKDRDTILNYLAYLEEAGFVAVKSASLVS